MQLQNRIAKNVKTIRENKKLTLDAAAKQTEVSRSMLAQIEKGEVNPTISVLWKIANGYKVSFTSLVENHNQEPLIIRAEDVAPLVEDDGKYINYPAFPFQEDKLFETYRIQIEPHGFLSARPHMAGTEEYITVFSGRVEIITAEKTFQLGEGDSLRFFADAPHSYQNIDSATAYLSMLIYYTKNQ
ncbi:helix-turn-helix domain-containing protein [Megasphaera cerevisiae]|nr:XRE family transcriptional regulator [Megasphaera cerevisiae]SJZ49659.1 transcriptional regulator, XRE family with cupin sensor [Megasphaera cerevisiae DSM 20462]